MSSGKNTIGGTSDDYLESVDQTTDGGYILGGWSSSGLTGDKTEGLIGGVDYWVVKVDSAGEIEWDNSIGGIWDDELYSVQQTTDGGYILGGYSESYISGDKTENSYGADYWVIKLNSSGDIEWQNTITGDLTDNLYYIQQTYEGGYFIGGYSNSGVGYDKTTGSYAETAYWVLKLNSTGEIIWQNSIESGNFQSAQQTSDGGYILAGYSFSGIFMDKTEGNIGGYDYWVVKIDSLGNFLWDNTIGGTADDYLYDVHQTNDGGYILGGYSLSGISGDKTEALVSGVNDIWIVKLTCESGAVFYYDADGDGFGDPDDFLNTCTVPPGYILDHTDCDDDDATIHPDAAEFCNGLDDNCNSIIDDGLPFTTYYSDFDGDGFGDALSFTSACSGPPADYVADNTDCNDLNEFMNPAIAEICNGLDDNCNSLIDEGLIAETYYLDYDGDGYGNLLFSLVTCAGFIPAGYVSDSTDCNDTNHLIHPDAIETCNGYDDNCDEIVDEGYLFYIYYFDADADGFGNAIETISDCSEFPPSGYVSDSTDCDDTNSFISELVIYFADMDGDLYGDASDIIMLCNLVAPEGYAYNDIDCDDSNPFVNPLSNEIQNGLDDNCNGETDEGYTAIEDFEFPRLQVYPNPNSILPFNIS